MTSRRTAAVILQSNPAFMVYLMASAAKSLQVIRGVVEPILVFVMNNKSASRAAALACRFPVSTVGLNSGFPFRIFWTEHLLLFKNRYPSIMAKTATGVRLPNPSDVGLRSLKFVSTCLAHESSNWGLIPCRVTLRERSSSFFHRVILAYSNGGC